MGRVALRELLEQSQVPRGGHPCRTCLALEQLQGDDREALLQFLNSEASARAIALALQKFGLDVTRSSVARHRREHPVQ